MDMSSTPDEPLDDPEVVPSGDAAGAPEPDAPVADPTENA